ncbi:hypothetical protein [Metamycoplasma auris]|uniref:Uncharacterized protein n=1 Tax=Metamycoplasma auris TaxID=51363 RepID=A0A2W7G0W2_9BACT|nr:hypothetical protein [Metamycoplasma auris]PZV99846.1 hypothetical protein BCF89_1063 [Metamycoplasma auris]
MTNEQYKRVAKIFILIGMILRFWLIIPLVIGILTLREIESPHMTESSKLTYGILNLFFVTIVGGIFLLLDKN